MNAEDAKKLVKEKVQRTERYEERKRSEILKINQAAAEMCFPALLKKIHARISEAATEGVSTTFFDLDDYYGECKWELALLIIKALKNEGYEVTSMDRVIWNGDYAVGTAGPELRISWVG